VLGPGDYILWLFGTLCEAGALVCAVRGRCVTRYFCLTLYMLAVLVVSVGRYVVFSRYGYSSPEYWYFYYYSDGLVTICLYFALMSLYSHVFGEMGVHGYLRVGSLLLMGATAWFSYQIVQGSSQRLLTRFVVELSQNLYFVGLVLTYLLWIAVVKLRETRTRLVQLVLSLGVYFSAFAANYALRNLYPEFPFWKYVPQVLALWLPLAWSYTFLRIPEEARIATARVAAEKHR
jgi:hypothetical protein